MARHSAVNTDSASYVGGAIGELADDLRPLLAITEQGIANVDYTGGTPERALTGFVWLRHWRAGSGLPNLDDAVSYVETYPHFDDSAWDPPDSTNLAGEVFEDIGTDDHGLVVIGQLDLAYIAAEPGSILNLMGAANSAGTPRWLRYSAQIIGADVQLSSSFFNSSGEITATVPASDPVIVLLYVEGGGAVTDTVIAISSARNNWHVGFIGSRS